MKNLYCLVPFLFVLSFVAYGEGGPERFSYVFDPGEELRYVLSAEGEVEFEVSVESVSRTGGRYVTDEKKYPFDLSIELEMSLIPGEDDNDGEPQGLTVYTDSYGSDWGEIEIFETERDFEKVFDEPFRVKFSRRSEADGGAVEKEDATESSDEPAESNISFVMPNGLPASFADNYSPGLRRVLPLLEKPSAGSIRKIALSNLGPQNFVAFMFPALPGNEIEEGDTWMGKAHVVSPLPFFRNMNEMEAEFTFEEYEDYNDINCAKFAVAIDRDVSSMIERDENYSHKKNEYIYRDIYRYQTFDVDSLDVELDGEIYFDYENGRIVAVVFALSQNMVATAISTKDTERPYGKCKRVSNRETTTRYYMSFYLEGNLELE